MRDSHTHLTLKLSGGACPIGRYYARAFPELNDEGGIPGGAYSGVPITLLRSPTSPDQPTRMRDHPARIDDAERSRIARLALTGARLLDHDRRPHPGPGDTDWVAHVNVLAAVIVVRLRVD